jgi:hypothetical protein
MNHNSAGKHSNQKVPEQDQSRDQLRIVNIYTKLSSININAEQSSGSAADLLGELNFTHMDRLEAALL